MSIQATLTEAVKQAVLSIYNANLETAEFQATRKEFPGDITLVVFSMLRVVKGNPVQIGETIGEYLVQNVEEVERFNVVKGFLNLEISASYFVNFFNTIKDNNTFGFEDVKAENKAVMVEYSSPNTNKPLHLGHVRNNLLGYSVAEILKASGKKVYKTQIINDRGIHICKSMLAWQRFGNGETPESTGLKGDKLVGNYYVKFDQEYKKELARIEDLANQAYEKYKNGNLFTEEEKTIFELEKKFIPVEKTVANKNLAWGIGGIALAAYLHNKSKDDNDLKGLSDLSLIVSAILLGNSTTIKKEFREQSELVKKKIIEKKPISKFEGKNEREIRKELFEEYKKLSPLIQDAQQMLQKWEAGDKEVVALWKKMNGWVYDGFNTTYKNLGVDFDNLYYESQTYLLGKEFIAEGLKTGVFFKKEDGSVWCDLTEDGLDEKIVLRSDGTAVYMTQDIGTAIQRVKDYPDVGGMVYTVGNEQEYHFQVLFLIIKKLGFDWAKNLFHLSYGMVDLPSGKMKSREGTVVDADDLIVEMADTAQTISEELGKLDGYTEDDKQDLYKTIGLGALKYYILKVDPKKRILFDPKESIDFQGNTGPFIQYTYARIQSILRKANIKDDVTLSAVEVSLNDKERELIKQLQLFPEVIQQAAKQHSPALIANYTYDLVKAFNSFYQNVSILGADTQNEIVFRVQLSQSVANTIKNAFGLLGIAVPERM